MSCLQMCCTRGVLICLLLFLSGCGALTGIPGHGGGKRFAIEQEMVAAATRGAIKQIDLALIRGKRSTCTSMPSATPAPAISSAAGSR